MRRHLRHDPGSRLHAAMAEAFREAVDGYDIPLDVDRDALGGGEAIMDTAYEVAGLRWGDDDIVEAGQPDAGSSLFRIEARLDLATAVEVSREDDEVTEFVAAPTTATATFAVRLTGSDAAPEIDRVEVERWAAATIHFPPVTS
ncbi:MAG: hypothetical protein ACFBWO_08995 [Paracoccaceae bacterium]